MEWVRIAGLMLDAAGVLVIASGAVLSTERGWWSLGFLDWEGPMDRSFKLPLARALLAESRRTFWGLLLIALGFGLQIVGNWPT